MAANDPALRGTLVPTGPDFALAVAGAFAFPVNRWLLKRGKGHTAVHNTGIHGGLPPRLVGTLAAVAFIFGVIVLAAEAFGGDDDSAPHEGGHSNVPALVAQEE